MLPIVPFGYQKLDQVYGSIFYYLSDRPYPLVVQCFVFYQVELLRDDLLAAKEANERAPTKTMKTVIEKLRNQLMLKEKQQKAINIIVIIIVIIFIER